MNIEKWIFDDLDKYIYLPTKITSQIPWQELKELEKFNIEHGKLQANMTLYFDKDKNIIAKCKTEEIELPILNLGKNLMNVESTITFRPPFEYLIPRVQWEPWTIDKDTSLEGIFLLIQIIIHYWEQ